MRIAVSLAVLLWANAFLFAQSPDWIRGKSKMYPDEFYIVGVGSGDTRQDAESRARAHIAEVFSVNIRADISVNKSETLTNRQGKISGESRETTRSRVDMGLKKTLEGTEIAEVWQDPKDAMFYALAVLDREKAAAKMAERVRELDNEVVRLGEQVDTVSGKVDKLKIMLLRKSLLSDRMSLDSDYRIVSPSGKGLPAPYSVGKVSSEIAAFLRSDFVVGVIANGPSSDVLAQTVTDKFTQNGFTVNPTGGQTADLVIKISSTTDPSAEAVGDWFYCRWRIEVNAADGASGEVVMSSSEGGRSGQLSIEESKRKAAFDMNRKMSVLAGKLMQKLTGED